MGKIAATSRVGVLFFIAFILLGLLLFIEQFNIPGPDCHNLQEEGKWERAQCAKIESLGHQRNVDTQPNQISTRHCTPVNKPQPGFFWEMGVTQWLWPRPLCQIDGPRPWKTPRR